MRVTGSALPEEFSITGNGSAFRVQRTNQIPFTLDIATVETLVLNAGDGADNIQAGDLSSVSDLATVRINGDAAADSLKIAGSAGPDQFVAGNALAPRLRLQRTTSRAAHL